MKTRRRCKWKRVDFESAPKQQSYRLSRSKHKSIRWNAFRTYLNGCVGLPWDEIYSSLWPQMRKSVRLMRTLEYFVSEIEHAPIYIYKGKYFQEASIDSPEDRSDFFVDKNGILCRGKSKKRPTKKEPVTYLKYDSLLSFALVNGIWFAQIHSNASTMTVQLDTKSLRKYGLTNAGFDTQATYQPVFPT